jgi:hypothetical protein
LGKECLNAIAGELVPCSAKTVSIQIGPNQSAVLVPASTRYKEAFQKP